MIFEILNETMKNFLLGLVVCFSRFCSGQLKDCFNMDGTSASMDFPCDPDAEASIDLAFILD